MRRRYAIVLRAAVVVAVPPHQLTATDLVLWVVDDADTARDWLAWLNAP